MSKRFSTKRQARAASRTDPSRPTSPQPTPPATPRRTRLWVVGGGALAIVSAVLMFGNRWVAHLANENARQELAAQHVDEAIEWFQWSLEWHEQSAETNLKLSRAFRRRGQFAECQEYLERARDLGLPDERYERERVLIQAQRGAIPPKEMDRQLARLLSHPDEDAAEISEAFANGYLVNQRYPEAMRLLDAWHLDYPDDAQPHYIRGIIWQHLGSMDRAEEEFRGALELEPTHYPAAMALGNFLVQRRRVIEALPYFELCVKAKNEGLTARVSAAQCMRLLGRHDEARARIEQILAEDPQMLAAGIELAHLDVAAGQYEHALSWLERGAAENPRDADTRYALATALAASGRSDEAREHFEYVDKARPAVSRARYLIISLNDDPNNTAARTEIGQLLLEYGSQQEGIFWLNSALAIDPTFPPAHLVLADFFAQQADRSADAAARARYHHRMALADAVGPSSGAIESHGASRGNGDDAAADDAVADDAEVRDAPRGGPDGDDASDK